MPVMNGFDAVREVRRLERLSGSSPQTIIGMSAQYDGYTLPFALAEGFDLFLAKVCHPTLINPQNHDSPINPKH